MDVKYVPELDRFNSCPAITAIDYVVPYGLSTQILGGEEYCNTVAEVIPVDSYYDNGTYGPSQINPVSSEMLSLPSKKSWMATRFASSTRPALSLLSHLSETSYR